MPAQDQADREPVHHLSRLRRDWGAVGGDRMTERPITTVEMVRTMLGRSPAWFYAHRLELEAKGFPAPIPVVGKYNPGAVREWIDRTRLTRPNGAGDSAPWKRAVV